MLVKEAFWKVGDSFIHPESKDVIKIESLVTNNLSMVFVSVNGKITYKGSRITMKVKEIDNLQKIEDGKNTSNNS